jgi:hypothetical protein
VERDGGDDNGPIAKVKNKMRTFASIFSENQKSAARRVRETEQSAGRPDRNDDPAAS